MHAVGESRLDILGSKMLCQRKNCVSRKVGSVMHVTCSGTEMHCLHLQHLQ